METKRLYRSDKNKIVAGVFGGLGKYANVDPVLLRLFWILITVFTGFVPGLVTYLLAIVIMPKKHEK